MDLPGRIRTNKSSAPQDDPISVQQRLAGHIPSAAGARPRRGFSEARRRALPFVADGHSGFGVVADLRMAMANAAANAAAQVRRRTRRTVAMLMATILALGGMALPAAAAQGGFDATDGVLDAGVSAQSDLIKDQDDDAYAVGPKEDDPCPQTDTGIVPPSKDDFSNFYADLEGDILYLAFERAIALATATIDFELNQSTVDCGNGVNPERTAGDVLITYDFKGGNLVTIQIRIWSGTEWGEPDDLDAAQAQASMSDDLLFGELTIDLVAAGIFNENECISFASSFAKSRSSFTFTSTLKDFVRPIPISISNCASITVVKDASPNGSTPFAFSFNPPGDNNSTGFNLIDDGSTSPDATPASRTFTELADVNGSYVITETDPAVDPGAWDLTGITCVGGTASYDVANNRVTVVPGGAVSVVCTFANTFDPPPTINVLKTARPTTLPEPGGSVTFDVVVTNTSNEEVTLTELTDTVDGVILNLADMQNSTCDVGAKLAASNATDTDTYKCSFTLNVSGNAGDTRTDVVTAVVVDAEGDTATDDDDAVVTLTNVLPTISVTKTANPTSLLEPGGNVTFTVVVTNLSNEAVTLRELIDTVGTSPAVDLFGNTITNTCDDDQALTAADSTNNGGGDTYTCTFTIPVTGDAGFVHANVVKATAYDDDGSPAVASDNAEVVITDVAPNVEVLKSTDTPTINEPGADVTYDVVINNLSNEAVTLTSLTDTVGGVTQSVFDIPGTTCEVGVVLAAASGATTDDTYTCSFTLRVTGNAGSTHDNRVTGIVVDNELTPATDSDVERVTIANVAPTVNVVKTASPLSVPEPGAPVTYTVVVQNLSNESVTLTDLTDTVAAADPTNLFTLAGSTCDDGQVLAAGDGKSGGADTYTCTFTATVTGNAGSTHVNVVDAIVVDDDDSTATDNDDAVVTVTDVLPGIQVVKTATPTLIRSGDTVTYTYAVTTTTSESLADVTLTDDKCASVSFVSGDTDGDDLLDPGETWAFQCVMALTVDTVNIVTATGTDDEGNKATDTDTASVDVTNPAIAVDKTVDLTVAAPGQTITYTYVVTNPGDGPLRPVTAVDDKCSPLAFISGDANADGALDPGESWTYTCAVVAGTTAGDLVNVVVVTGTPLVGPAVTATDTASVNIVPAVVQGVVLTAPEVQPAQIERPATLPVTGSDPGIQAAVGLALLMLGGLALIPEHLRRRRNGVEPIQG